MTTRDPHNPPPDDEHKPADPIKRRPTEALRLGTGGRVEDREVAPGLERLIRAYRNHQR